MHKSPHANVVISQLSAVLCALPVLKAGEWLHQLWKNARGVWQRSLVSLRGLWCNHPHCHKQCSLVWQPSDRLHSSEFECLSFPHQRWFIPPALFAWCCFLALQCWQATAGFISFMALYKRLWEQEVKYIITFSMLFREHRFVTYSL